MKKFLPNFVVGALIAVKAYAIHLGETRVLVGEHEWSLNS